METALDFILLESSLIKNSVIRQEIDDGTGLPGLTYNGKKPVFQFLGGNSSLITILINAATLFHPYRKPAGQRIHHGRTYAM